MMPIAIRSEGEVWAVTYRGHVVAEASTEAEANRLARRAVERLLANVERRAQAGFALAA